MYNTMTTAEFIRMYHSLTAFQKEQIDKEIQYCVSMNNHNHHLPDTIKETKETGNHTVK